VSDDIAGSALPRLAELCAAAWPDALTGVYCGRVYSLVPEGVPAPQLARSARWVVSEARRAGQDASIGLCRAARRTELPSARRMADLAAELGADRQEDLVDAAENEDELFVMAVRGLIRRQRLGPGTRLAVLSRHDADNGTEYVATLRTYLECFGDVGKVARRMYLHPNTVRNRLDRITRMASIDLSDPAQRLALEIRLAAGADEREDRQPPGVPALCRRPRSPLGHSHGLGSLRIGQEDPAGLAQPVRVA
jgi:hypothetical protein